MIALLGSISTFNYYFYLKCMPILPACMSEHYMCLVPMEAREGIMRLEVETAGAAVWVLGIEARAFGRVPSALSLSALSL